MENNMQTMLNVLEKMRFDDMKFVRGLGIIPDRFVLTFSDKNNKINLEIETNLRVRSNNTHFLSFNDLYLNKSRKQMSIKKYRKQNHIESTYLHESLDQTNKLLHNEMVKCVKTKEYGDVIIQFINDMVIEIFNDTHFENAVLYRLIINNKMSNVIECCIENNKPTFIVLDYSLR